MIPLQQAQAKVNESLGVLDPVEIDLSASRGLVLAETVVATESIPPFDNTAMDGFAVRSVDTKGASEDAPVVLPVVATIAAGSVANVRLAEGEAMRIMTGAPVPDGADAVVMVEQTNPKGFDVEVMAEVPAGNHIRLAGDDVKVGAEIMHPGTVLSPAHLGVLASLGREKVCCYPRPRVGVFSTGDELVEGSVPLKPGQIRDSNRIMLLSLVSEAGFEPVDLGCISDDEAAIEQALEVGAESCDAIVTSGGVSMGDYDFVKAVLSRLGDFSWMQVAIRPAKPLAFGLMGTVPVFGLPGNPVSSLVSFELFARPGLRRMMGYLDAQRPRIMATAGSDLKRRSDGKIYFQRVVLKRESDGFIASSAGGQGSHQLGAMAVANALAIVPDGDGVAKGDPVQVMYLGSNDSLELWL